MQLSEPQNGPRRGLDFIALLRMTVKNKFFIFSRSTDKSQRMPKQDLDAISRAYPDDENEVNFEY